MNRKKICIPTRRLAMMALLVSLNIILSRILSLRIPMGGIEGVRIGFGPLPVIFAGLAFGPWAGFVTGALGDLVGYFVNPMGAYIPVFTITAGLRGLIPALVWRMLGQRETFMGVLPAVALSGLVSALCVPLCIKYFFGVPLATTMPPALVAQCFTIPIYTFIFIRLYGRYHRSVDRTRGV